MTDTRGTPMRARMQGLIEWVIVMVVIGALTVFRALDKD